MSLESIKDRLRSVMGLDPESLSKIALRSNVRKRMQACELDTREAYAELLRRDPTEIERLANAVVVHETSFFRYPASFELLATDATKAGSARGPVPYRTLCVACSTGEEPTSVVMSLLGAGLAPPGIRVEANDLSVRAIDYARAGLYRRRGVLRLPPEVRARWFEDEGMDFRLSREVRDCVRYRTANALDSDFGYSEHKYDAIFCRNLMIYLVPDARERLLEALFQRLRPGGLLFVGHAEVPAVRALGLTMAVPPDAFACRMVRASAPKPAQAPEGPARVRPQPVAAPRPAASRAPARNYYLGPPPKAPARAVAAPADVLDRAARLADEGDLDQARRIVSDLIATGAPSADHYHLLAVIEGARGRDVATGDALRRALYLDPEHYPALVQLALLADARGDRDHAGRVRAKAERVRAAWDAARGDGSEGGRP